MPIKRACLILFIVFIRNLGLFRHVGERVHAAHHGLWVDGLPPKMFNEDLFKVTVWRKFLHKILSWIIKYINIAILDLQNHVNFNWYYLRLPYFLFLSLKVIEITLLVCYLSSLRVNPGGLRYPLSPQPIVSTH